MNQRSDIDRLLRHWMDDGPTRMPDRIVDVVADRISVQRQRRSWRLLQRFAMNPLIKFGIAVAAVLVIVVGGWNLLPGRGPDTGGPAPTPTLLPTASPNASPPALPNGSLEAREYVARAVPGDPMAFVVTAPAGWSGFGGWAMSGPVGSGGPSGIGIAFLHAPQVTSSPCDQASMQPSLPPSGPTVDDLVAALSAREDVQVTGLTDTVLGGRTGKRIDVQLPAVLACSQWYVFAEPQGFFAQGPANRWRVWVLDADGDTAVVVLSDFAGTSAADSAAAQAVIDSLTISD